MRPPRAVQTNPHDVRLLREFRAVSGEEGQLNDFCLHINDRSVVFRHREAAEGLSSPRWHTVC
jgi:hypothetical protein